MAHTQLDTSIISPFRARPFRLFRYFGHLIILTILLVTILSGCEGAPTLLVTPTPPFSPVPLVTHFPLCSAPTSAAAPLPSPSRPLSTHTPVKERIGFVARKQGVPALCTIDGDGTNLTCVIADPGIDADAAWSPDGSRIAFTYYPSRGESYIYLINNDGTGLARFSTQANSLRPVWSPDGNAIAYNWVAKDGTHSDIFVQDVKGGQAKRLTDNQARDVLVDWSPDGSRLFFLSDRDGERLEIYVMNVDGTGSRRLTSTGLDKSYVDLSPDGAKLLFVGAIAKGREADPMVGMPDTRYRLFVLNSDGSGLTQLPFDHGVYDPSWSPQGDKIVFVGVEPRGIYIIDSDGTNLQLLVEGDVAHPRWSPDGTRIAFRCDGDICIVDCDGTNLRALNTKLPSESYLQWIR